MKKILTVTVAFMMMFTLVALQANAGPNCGAKADLAGSKSASCSKMSKEACMAKYGMSEEECKAMCKELGTGFELTQISVKGMTCGGCERKVTEALQEVPGVVKVVKVSYTDGTALVAVNPLLSKDQLLIKSIADQGFSSEIIPAVARFDGSETKSTLTDSKAKAASCSKSGGKSCCSRGAKGVKATSTSATSSETKTSNSSNGDTK